MKYRFKADVVFEADDLNAALVGALLLVVDFVGTSQPREKHELFPKWEKRKEGKSRISVFAVDQITGLSVG